MEPAYITIKESGQAEIVVKKSRFISYAESISGEESAKKFIDSIKEKHKDASHNTYAYVIGKETKTERYSDDGEPSGTAGMPILEKIRHFGLTDTVVVVTRYFGGTLLGTGGLARAYSKGAEQVISLCGMSCFTKGFLVMINTDYHFLGKVQNYIQGNGYSIVDENYADHVIIRTLIPLKDYDKAKKQITELTGAKARIDVVTEQYIEMES